MKIATLMFIHDLLEKEIERRTNDWERVREAYGSADENAPGSYELRKLRDKKRDFLGVAEAAMRDFDSHDFS